MGLSTRETVAILDFGSQYTQLIARKIRELHIYCEILPYNTTALELKSMNVKAIILSGGPSSIYDDNGLKCASDILICGLPVLGICYGMHLIVSEFGGVVSRSSLAEYGKAELHIDFQDSIFNSIPQSSRVWMSHGDSIVTLPSGFKGLASTINTSYAAIKKGDIYGLQFHPEVVHTEYGHSILSNFLFKVCGLRALWTSGVFIEDAILKIRGQVGDEKVICALSGGVDSAVTAVLLQRVLGDQLTCIFVDNGLLRLGEAESVRNLFQRHFKLNLRVVDAKDIFLSELEGVNDPEKKRKIIGHQFIKIFEKEALKIDGVSFLAQGTLYPDVIESHLPNNPSVVIKSHHNVGGLPKNMKLKLIEPLRELFKDEVRSVGLDLGLPSVWVHRHPFPGPGLAIRVLGEVTEDRLDILRLADNIALEEIHSAGLYDDIWQAFVVLLPVKAVGVMGDNRTYENVVSIRCVNSKDGMTADWYPFPYDVLAKISNRIINEISGINRVVYDITSKPPGTIEWE